MWNKPFDINAPSNFDFWELLNMYKLWINGKL